MNRAPLHRAYEQSFSSASKMSTENKMMKKDQGWSWMVLAAVSLAQMLALGQVLTFGIFFVELLDEFKCTRHEAALVGALAFGVKCFTAAPASIAQKKYGCERVVMAGGFLAALGTLLSYFATKLWHLYVTYGIVVGLGFGCTFVPSVGALPDYFEKYRFFATAFAPVGSALGTFVFSPFNNYLIETYTWRGAMMILSGVSLQIIVCGAVLRSRTKQRDLPWGNLVEKSLFTNKKFLLFTCDAFCFGGSTYIVFTMANSLAISLGLTKAQSTHVVATMGFCNVAGRLISAGLSAWPNLNRPLMFAVASLLGGLGALICTAVKTWWAVALFLGLFGLGLGVKVSQLGPVVMELFGVARLVNGMGYYMFLVGISGILGPWAAGLLVDKTQVESAFWMAGILSLFSTIICFYIVIWQSRSSGDPDMQSEMPPVLSPSEIPLQTCNDTHLDLSPNDHPMEIINHENGPSTPNDQLKFDSARSRLSDKAPEPTPRRGWRPALLFYGEM